MHTRSVPNFRLRMKSLAKTPFLLLLALMVSPVATSTAQDSDGSNVAETGRSVHDTRTVLTPSALGSVLHPNSHAGHDHGPGEHWCGTDFSDPSAKAAIAQFMADREAGVYPIARKGHADPDVGDRQVFNVNEDNWMPLEFELVDKTSLYYLWVEVEELNNGNVTPTKIAQLQASIHDATPSRSVNPAQGTFANIHDVFGLPPNVDGDGLVDILMYDIRTSGVLGYVHPADLVQNPPDGVGNQRDVLYLDSNEGTRNVSTLSVIAAHEYTHLVHQAFGSDQTFLSEGYAEYAMVMNGFYWRGVGFVASPAEVSLPLFTWRPDQVSVGARGYERGGLFITYIGEQHGPNVVGQMLRDTQKKGAAGMDSVLALHGSSLSDVILDYHTANRLNDKSIDPRFGYNEPERSSHQAFLTSPPINGELPSTSGEGGFTFEFEENINSGAVHYLQLSQVSNVSLVYDTPDPTGIFYETKTERNRARLILESTDGSMSFRDIEPSQDQITVDGEFETITFVLVHERPEVAIGDRSSLSAGWTPLSLATDVADEPAIPAPFGLQSVYPNPFSHAATVNLELDQSGPVMLEMLDMLGRVVDRADHGILPAGSHSVSLDAGNLSSGTYLVRLVSGSNSATRLVSLVR